MSSDQKLKSKKAAVKNLPSFQYEMEVGYPFAYVAGADEVGRGCLAGPVVAGAVILPLDFCPNQHPWLIELNDSKKLSSVTREKLSPLILRWAVSYGIGLASVEEIDEINIFHASHLAIERAIQKLTVPPGHILVDGKFLPERSLGAPATALVKGDQKSLSIAAASIIAKVWRDRHMLELDSHFPGYGFAQHKGYPTPAHFLSLKKNGVSEVHRKSFRIAANPS